MTVTLYGSMEGKARFSGLPGGAVGGGGKTSNRVCVGRSEARIGHT